MMSNASLSATARVIIKKYDENGTLIDTEQHTVKLSEEEAKKLCLSPQQD